MSGIEIRERDFDAFFRAPFEAYGQGSPFVSVFRDDLERFLDTRKNPLFARFGAGTWFTAHREGRPIGRITAHVHDASNRSHDWNRGYFGWFDCADDPEAARALLAASETWSRARGHTEIWGNFNLTAMQQIGVVTGGFEHAPYSDQVWNPPHLPRLLEANGYSSTFPMTSFEVDLAAIDLERVLRPEHAAVANDPSLVWEPVRVRSLGRVIPELCDVLNDGFARNPMFVPLTHEEFQFQAKDLMWVIDGRISVLVRQQGALVGALICIPDLNPFLRAERSRAGLLTLPRLLAYRRRCRRAVVVFQSVRRPLQNRGVGAVMIHRMLRALRAAGYEKLGVTWVADENVASLQGVMRASAQPLHRLHLFRKPL